MTTSYLTAPNAEKTQRTYRYICELASNELELDRNGIPVPKHFQTVDVVVTEPTEAAIATQHRSTVRHWLDIGAEESDRGSGQPAR